MMRSGERGFTLIEVVIALALVSMVTAGSVMTTAALLANHEQCNDRTIVLVQAQNAGGSISRDVQMAKGLVLGEPGGFPLTLDIPVDADENNDYSVVYLFDGDQLKRQVYDPSAALISESVAARYIDGGETTFSFLEANSYRLTLKAVKGEAVVVRGYEVTPRIASR
jgi:prepilin-type N-terminal cleavage/methylation domain-containing protein